MGKATRIAVYTASMTFKVFLQYALPHRFLSRLVYWATRWTFAPWKNWLIATIVRWLHRHAGCVSAEAARIDWSAAVLTLDRAPGPLRPA